MQACQVNQDSNEVQFVSFGSLADTFLCGSIGVRTSFGGLVEYPKLVGQRAPKLWDAPAPSETLDISSGARYTGVYKIIKSS